MEFTEEKKDFLEIDIVNGKVPIVFKGEIETQSKPAGNLQIHFPNIDQKYFIDIHPID